MPVAIAAVSCHGRCFWLFRLLDMGPGSKFVETNLDSFEANWILELEPALDPSLRLGSSNHGLTFLVLFLLVATNWFSLHDAAMSGLASVYHFLVFDPHLKVPGVQFMTLIEYFDGPFTKIMIFLMFPK